MKNLKYYQIILFILFFNNVIYAQKDKQNQGLRIGFKMGSNISSFYGELAEDTSIKTGLNIGFLTEIIISDKFSVQPELIYSRQGAFFDSATSFKRKLNYMNLPLVGKYYVFKNISVDLGPQIGVLLNSKDEIGVEEYEVQNIRKVDFSVLGGLTYEFNSGLFFQGRYCLGITNLNTINNNRLSTSLFQIGLGYQF